MEHTNIMNILYTLDDGFYDQLVVSFYSLIKQVDCELTVYVVSEHISEKYRNYLIQISKHSVNVVNIVFLMPPRLPKKLIPDRGSRGQYYRLFIEDIFQNIDIQRVLYLDADTLIMNKDIQRLETMSLQGKCLGVCLDPWSIRYRDALDLHKNSPIFNSGVMVIDVNLWKKEAIGQKVAQDINSHELFYQGDQGILNRVFENNIMVVSAQFNVLDIYFSMSYHDMMEYRKAVHFYDEYEINNCLTSPNIVHFTSSFLQNRPWIEGSTHPLSKYWLTLYKESTGDSMTLLKPKATVLILIKKITPKFFSSMVLSFFQASVRPVIWKIKKK